MVRRIKWSIRRSGDTVNLASRLESLNKEHKTQLLMSEETRRLLPESLDAFCLGDVQVRGKTVPMKIYTAAEAARTHR